MNKATKTILTIVVILLVTALAFYPRLKTAFAKKEESKDAKTGAAKGEKPKGAGGPTAVEVMVVKSSSMDDKILATGTIIPNEEVEIRSEIAGRVTSINFKEGDFATKGQILLKINDADLQAQLLKLGYQKKLAEVNDDRQKRLLEKEAISQREYDISNTNLNSVNADIESLKAQLAKTVIRAPFNGRIGLRYISDGSYLSPATRIATLTSVIPAKLDFSIPAKYANNVQKGTKIEFSVEGEDRKHNGTVYAVEPKIDPNTRTLTLRAIAPNANGKLVPGSFARVEIVLSSKPNAIVIPTEAVIPDVKGYRVFVVKNKKSESVLIEIGVRTDRSVEIISGLSLGDSLITSGIQQVKSGGEVEIKN